MLGIFNVLVAGIAARMTGDELGIKVDAEAIGIGFEGQAAVSVLRGNGIGVGVERDAELAGSDRGRGARDIIGMWIEPRQMRTLFLQHVEGSWMRALAMVSSQTCAAAWMALSSLNSSPRKKFFLT